MATLKQHPLGQTGLTLSELGLGTVKFGRNTDIKYPKDFVIPDPESLAELLDIAQSLGINYLDTAPAYGSSETTLGALLRHKTNHWVISTKVGEYYENQQSRYDFSRETTVQSVHSSLKKLRLETLDLVYVHSNGEDQWVIEDTDVLPTLLELKQQGLIRAIGFSGKTVAGARLAMPHVDAYMIALNESDTSQAELIAECKQQNKGVVIKKALASGHSTNPSEALKFVARYPGVTSTIVGTINPKHLKDNVDAVIGV